MQPESASFARWKEAHLRATHAEEHFYGQLCSNGIGLLEEQVHVCELRREATAALLFMLCDMTERASNVRSTALESAAAPGMVAPSCHLACSPLKAEMRAAT
jgi:hypothetical protein